MAATKIPLTQLKSDTWTSWTPSLTGVTIGNGTLSGAYQRIGNTIIAKFHFKMGTTSAITGTVQFALPVSGVSSMSTLEWNYIGNASLTDEGTAVYGATIHTNSSTTTATLYAQDAAATYLRVSTAIGSTVPFTWTSTDKISAIIIYEA